MDFFENTSNPNVGTNTGNKIVINSDYAKRIINNYAKVERDYENALKMRIKFLIPLEWMKF